VSLGRAWGRGPMRQQAGSWRGATVAPWRYGPGGPAAVGVGAWPGGPPVVVWGRGLGYLAPGRGAPL